MEYLSRLAARPMPELSARLHRAGTLIVLPLCGFLGTVFAQSAPQASVSTPVQFGTIAFGSTLTLQVPVTNTGGLPLTISPSISGPSYKIVGAEPAGCLQGTPAGQTCTLKIEFSPVTVGPHDDNLTLQTNGGASPVVRLRGVASGIGSQMEGPLEFPPAPFGSSRMKTLRIDNVHIGSDVTIQASVSGPSFKVLNTASNTCVFGVATGQSCQIPIEFVPSSVGRHEDTLTVTSSAGTTSTSRLEGEAVAAVAPTPLPHGEIFVPDEGDRREQIFSKTGAYRSGFTSSEPSNSAGTDGFYFYSAGCSIRKYDANNNWLVEFGFCFGGDTSTPGYSDGSGIIAVTSTGNIWLALPYYLQEFDGSFNFIKNVCMGADSSGGPRGCPSATPYPVTPSSIALDAADNIYLIIRAIDDEPEEYDGNIVKLDKTGKYLATYGPISSARSIAVAPNGNIYVAVASSNSVQVLDPNGVFQFDFGATGTGEGQFFRIGDVVLDGDGNAYVTDSEYFSSRVEKFDSAGRFLSQFGSYGSGDGQFVAPLGLAIVK